MAAEDLGTKRVCPACSAKFYDFGAVAPFTCPKCAHAFTPEIPKPVVIEPAPKPKPKPKPVVKDDQEDEMSEELGGIEALEGFDDEYDDDVVSLEEVEEHQEDSEIDRNSDDADDEMFIDDSNDHEKLVDSLSDYKEELELDDEDE